MKISSSKFYLITRHLIKRELRILSNAFAVIFSKKFVCCQAYSEMIAERRERVTNGVEDTFGQGKNQ